MLHNMHTQTSVLRPVEVVTSVERRRRWHPEVKARIVAESYAPGVKVTDVARLHGISAQHLHLWRRAARAGKLVLPLDDDLAFAEVQLHRDAELARPSSGGVEVEIDGAVVRVWPDTDLRLAAAVFRALKAPV